MATKVVAHWYDEVPSAEADRCVVAEADLGVDENDMLEVVRLVNHDVGAHLRACRNCDDAAALIRNAAGEVLEAESRWAAVMQVSSRENLSDRQKWFHGVLIGIARMSASFAPLGDGDPAPIVACSTSDGRWVYFSCRRSSAGSEAGGVYHFGPKGADDDSRDAFWRMAIQILEIR